MMFHNFHLLSSSFSSCSSYISIMTNSFSFVFLKVTDRYNRFRAWSCINIQNRMQLTTWSSCVLFESYTNFYLACLCTFINVLICLLFNFTNNIIFSTFQSTLINCIIKCALNEVINYVNTYFHSIELFFLSMISDYYKIF